VKRKASVDQWLPLAKARRPPAGAPTGDAFRGEWIDFEHGIRVGNLEPEERITQILKFHLERAYSTPFITDRWGRGVYWQWICWLPRANRQAKPISHKVNFGCAKFFISADRAERTFKSGLQIERGHVSGPEPYPGVALKPDWDWHRLIAQARPRTALDRELRRLVHDEGFVIEVGDWSQNLVLRGPAFRSAAQITKAAATFPDDGWVGFQLYYPMSEQEVRSCSGPDLVRAVRAVFAQVVPAMNACMQVPLEPASARSGGTAFHAVTRN